MPPSAWRILIVSLGFCALAGLSLACDADLPSEPSQRALEPAGPPWWTGGRGPIAHQVSGTGTAIDVDGSGRPLKVDIQANTYSGGGVSGYIRGTGWNPDPPYDPLDVTLEVRCLRVAGQSAWIGATFIKSTHPDLLGTDVIFVVRDFGSGILDRIGFLEGAAASRCVVGPFLSMPDYPLVAGNYFVDRAVPPVAGGPRVTVRLHNIDDRLVAYITNSTFSGSPFMGANYFQDTGEVDITSIVRPGPNTIDLLLYNYGVGWTYGYALKIDGVAVWSGQCGTVGVLGCANNDYTTGIAYRTSFTFDWPPGK